jgi:hypothetical protein
MTMPRTRCAPSPRHKCVYARLRRAMAKRSGERVGVRGTFSVRPPHPILHVATSELPSPRKRGEGSITTNAGVLISHHFKQPISFPRRVFAPGFCFLASRNPKEGVAERRETYGCLRGIRWACTIGAGQAPGEAPCVPIRGTPASRRSHRGDFGRRGRASPHRHCGRIGHSELPHPAGGPCLPRRRLRVAAAGRHASLRLQDASGRRPSKSKAENLYNIRRKS